MMRSLIFILSLLVLPTAQALEYLSDEELATLDGYTSEAMLKEYDAEGNVIFRRGDNEACRYGQSDANDDARAGCEAAFEEDADALMASSFQRFLDQSFALMEPDAVLDSPGDGVQNLDLSVRLDDFAYNHFMCDGMPAGGIVRLDGVSITGPNGGDVRIQAATSMSTVLNTNTGENRESIVIKTQPIIGHLSIEAIRLGNSEEAVEDGPSIGRLRATSNGAQIEISRIED